MHLKESPAGSKPAFILNAPVTETSMLLPVNHFNWLTETCPEETY
jgi:hypothetical protein